MGSFFVVLADLCDPPPIGDCSAEALDAFGRALGVVALGWAIALALILRAGRHPRWRSVSTVASVPLLVIVPLLFADELDGVGGFAAFAGWIWGVVFAGVVRRLVPRPVGWIDEPIRSPGGPWEFARFAFGIAIAAPLLSPLVWAISSAVA